MISISSFSQSIHSPQVIGQTNKNQAVGRGFWVKNDTALFTCKFWLPSGAGAGKVLTSNANGFGTWGTPAVRGWGLTGNSGTDPSVNFIGTTDTSSLMFKIHGDWWGRLEYNNSTVAFGYNAAFGNTGYEVVAIGNAAIKDNTGVGVIGIGNTASAINTGSEVIGIGSQAANFNTGSYVVGVGLGAAATNTGSNVIGIGNAASNNNTGSNVIGIGLNAALSNTDNNTLFINLSGGNGDSTNSIIYANQNLSKVKINASLQINDGTQATGYVLTSDANGVGSWGLAPIITSGTSAPATTPNKVGDIFVDTSAKKLYFATGTSSSADWTIAN